ncbi:hypothetical protein N0V83_008314 [Neocucurbitaria cava]|uniref:Uncharacterized protein n=1 Tax=Neocucurbitaria cava TaxID=798079 RepID=A0A9W8Y1R7_9PLEO|nr:hypothetical protein N0V83_008314 [Neocucurbitaria cava]
MHAVSQLQNLKHLEISRQAWVLADIFYLYRVVPNVLSLALKGGLGVWELVSCLKLDTVRLVDLGDSVGWIVWTPMFNADGTVHSAEPERTLGARPTAWGTATWDRASRRDPTQTYDEERYPRHLSFRRIVPLDSDRFEPPPQVADELGIDTPLLSI